MNPIFTSIRWRLQVWYGLILVVVLAGFGFTSYQLERNRLLGRIDEELNTRVAVLFKVLRNNGPKQDGGPAGAPGQPPDDGPQDGPPDDGGPDRPGPPPLRHLVMSPSEVRMFGSGEPGEFYFVIWRRDGQEMMRSTNGPTFAMPAHRDGAPMVRDREGMREAWQFTPPGECLLVGRSIARDMAEMHRVAAWLGGVGGVVLLLGLAGGWWNATRALRPIEDISATAAKIAAGDLSQRINVSETKDELGQLADVLNSTFARLDAAFAQQGRFASDAAHELRTPVSVMLTQTQTALNRERSPAEYRQTLESCQRAAQRMRRLIESLLELARLDAGQEQMKRSRFDLGTTARECAELVQPLADGRGVKIQCDVPALPCLGDSERLSQVITNLVTNAIQYNNDKGEVRLTGEQKNGTVTLTVADNGQGISAEDLPKVFERFYRADKVRTSAAGNAGLGLSISKAIVEAHGGTIEVTSTPGVGTAFTLRLPAA